MNSVGSLATMEFLKLPTDSGHDQVKEKAIASYTVSEKTT